MRLFYAFFANNACKVMHLVLR